MRFARSLPLLLLLAVATPVWAQQAPHPAVSLSHGPRATHPARLETYGGTAESRLLVPATAFLLTDTSFNYFGLTQRIVTTCCDGLYAPLHLPSGAKVVSLELDYFDNTAAGAEYGALVICDFEGNNCTVHPTAGDGPGDCVVPGEICSGTMNAPGSSFLYDTLIANDNITIDNENNQYILFAANTTYDQSTAVSAMIVGYKLQVSPAPFVATFNDVPTSDPAFQFIEAFVAAGITVGCQTNPALYCPDDFVTRRQMAVFFAKALGLQFP